MVPLTSEGEEGKGQSRGWEQLGRGRRASREGPGTLQILTKQSSGSKDRAKGVKREETRRVEVKSGGLSSPS